MRKHSQSFLPPSFDFPIFRLLRKTTKFMVSHSFKLSTGPPPCLKTTNLVFEDGRLFLPRGDSMLSAVRWQHFLAFCLALVCLASQWSWFDMISFRSISRTSLSIDWKHANISDCNVHGCGKSVAGNFCMGPLCPA